jgi:hypothetical protein
MDKRDGLVLQEREGYLERGGRKVVSLWAKEMDKHRQEEEECESVRGNWFRFREFSQKES